MSTTPTGRSDRSMMRPGTALAVVLLLGIGACGDDTAGPTTTAAGPTTTAAATTTTTTAAATTTTSVLATGLVWSRVPHDDAVFGERGDNEWGQVMRSVVVGGPGLVAVGSDGLDSVEVAAVWTSTDGRSWSRVHDEAVFGERGDHDWGQLMRSVVVGGPGLVAVGSDGSVAAVWTSTDGRSWSRVPHDDAMFDVGAGWQQMSSVVVGGPGLVAVGYNIPRGDMEPAVWTSTDGRWWSPVPHDDAVFGGGGDQRMTSVVVGGPGLVAVGYVGEEAVGPWDAAVWTSIDGTSWSRVPHDDAVFGGDGDQVMSSVVVGGPGLVAVGYDNPVGPWVAAVWTSIDGRSWSRVPHDEAVFGGSLGWQEMSSVVVGGPGLVAVGYDSDGRRGGERGAAVWTSIDGMSWSRVHDEAVFGGGWREMASVVVGGPGLVAVGGDGSLGDGVAAVWVSPPPG